jgi:predicted P-loop ATPase
MFLQKIAARPEFFTDSIKKLENDKDTMEKIQGKWIIEVGELNAMSKADVNGVKLFMSSNCDVYRAAYARTPEEHPRRCVIFGTTNDGDFLRDTTGNRRFWPVDCYMKKVPEKTDWIVNELPKIVPQLWAEAKERYEKFGESPEIKDKELEKVIAKVQEAHRVRPVNEGVIIEFVNRKVPKNWKDMDIIARREFWTNNPSAIGEDDLVERDSICAQEIWCELYGKDINDMQRKDTVLINSVLCGLEGFEHYTKPVRVMSKKCRKESIHTYGETVKGFLRETE